MTILLVVLVCIVALVGFFFVSQAPAGVAILARIAQASSHHGEVKRMIQAQDRQSERAPRPPGDIEQVRMP